MLSFFCRQLRIVTPYHYNGTEAFYMSLSEGFAFFFPIAVINPIINSNREERRV